MEKSLTIKNSFVIGNIGWKDFKQQKLTIIRLSSDTINDYLSDEDHNNLMGLLNLMDHIQDQAYDTGCYDKSEIYLTKAELDQDNIDHGIEPDKD